METEIYRDYKFGVGGINKILEGDIDKADSFEDLRLQPQKGLVILPQIIGIYQYDNRFNGDLPMEMRVNDHDNQGIFGVTGSYEKINPNLICLVYDHMNISKDLLKDSINGDVLERLKLVKAVDIPEFYEKDVPSPIEALVDYSMRGSDIPNSIIDKDKNLLEMAKEEFGLTRFEAVELLFSEDFLNKPVQSDIIITAPKRKIIIPRRNPGD